METLRRNRPIGGAALAAALLLSLAACGGGDDDGDSASSTTAASVPTDDSAAGGVGVTTTTPTTTSPPVTTTSPPTTVAYVTDGATIQVANASGTDGAAGRLTERLSDVGYRMVTATNSSADFSRIATTQIFYAPDAPAVLAVAESLQAAFGGNGELVELTESAPTESGNVPESVNIVVLVGDDIVDTPLDELQGVTGDAADDTATEDSAADTSAP